MTSVYFFVPNIIGYFRVIFAFAAFYFAFDNALLFSLFYGVSEIMDALDGHYARKFNQTSLFGAVLDQVTDRCSTAGLMVILAVLYPKFCFVFISMLILDIGAHWFQMYSSLAVGKTTHKDVSNARFLLRLYYENRVLMFVAHGCNEIVWACLIVLSQKLPPFYHSFFTWAMRVCIPLCVFKQITNLLQLEYAAEILVASHKTKE